MFSHDLQEQLLAPGVSAFDSRKAVMVTRNSLLPRHSELLWGLEPRRLTETVPVGAGRWGEVSGFQACAEALRSQAGSGVPSSRFSEEEVASPLLPSGLRPVPRKGRAEGPDGGDPGQRQRKRRGSSGLPPRSGVTDGHREAEGARASLCLSERSCWEKVS